jgi:hypothetical protein
VQFEGVVVGSYSVSASSQLTGLQWILLRLACAGLSRSSPVRMFNVAQRLS